MPKTKPSIKKQLKEEGNYAKGEILGLSFVIWRNPTFGHWCGYVGVPKDSRLDGKNYYFYTESENGLSKLEQAINDISVHGGLTYAGKLGDRAKDDLWYFGFDCAHSGDTSPYMIEKYPELEGANDWYKDKEFVMTEIENLTKQLKEIIDLNL